MSQPPPKPKLTLKFNPAYASSSSAAAAARPSTPSAASSSAPSKPSRKASVSSSKSKKPPPAIKLKTKAAGAQTPTSSSFPSATPKTGGRATPTITFKSSSFPGPLSAPLASPRPVPVSLKIKPPKHPSKKRKPYEIGNGYDSEASDREDDVYMEENFILRMPPGEDCDYVRGMIERKELDTSSEFSIKFKDPRRAVVKCRGRMYSAQLVDLPCIIEANKTLDKKQLFKAADVAQMLLVGDRIQHESEVTGKGAAKVSDHSYPHGITPPMQHVRRRRFRKRVNTRTIEAVEDEVERLLRDDEKAEKTEFKLMDAAELEREAEDDLMAQEYDTEMDAEGEMDEEYPAEEAEMDEGALAAGLEEMLGTGSFADTGGSELELQSTGHTTVPETPAADDEESDEDDEDEEEVKEMDEGQRLRLQEVEKLKEEIADLEAAVRGKQKELSAITNQTLRGRIFKTLEHLQTELELKQEALQNLEAFE